MNQLEMLPNKKTRILYIKERLQKDDRWLYRALVCLYERQTEEEKYNKQTSRKNGMGFNAFDAELLTRYAQMIIKGEGLGESQKREARRMIGKYAGQLYEISKERL